MTKKKKIIEQFLKNPRSLKYKEIEKILITSGFVKIEAKGSHLKFKHPQLRKDLIIPVHNNDCKDFYKALALKIYKSINFKKK